MIMSSSNNTSVILTPKKVILHVSSVKRDELEVLACYNLDACHTTPEKTIFFQKQVINAPDTRARKVTKSPNNARSPNSSPSDTPSKISTPKSARNSQKSLKRKADKSGLNERDETVTCTPKKRSTLRGNVKKNTKISQEDSDPQKLSTVRDNANENYKTKRRDSDLQSKQKVFNYIMDGNCKHHIEGILKCRTSSSRNDFKLPISRMTRLVQDVLYSEAIIHSISKVEKVSTKDAETIYKKYS
ncbi:uncharacterized protein LOC120325987 isoform X2 [Styela clava]